MGNTKRPAAAALQFVFDFFVGELFAAVRCLTPRYVYLRKSLGNVNGLCLVILVGCLCKARICIQFLCVPAFEVAE